MLIHLRNNFQYYLLLLIWWQLGAYYAMLGSILVVLSALYFKSSGFNEEFFIGFLFLLILSDNLDFASSAKNIYIVLFAVLFFFSGNDLQFTNRFFFNFIPYFFIAIICLFFSDNFFSGFQKTLSYILLFISVPNYVENLYRKSGTEFFRSLIFFCGIIISLGILFYLVIPYSVSLEGRYKGNFFRNPNGLGLFCFLLFILFSVLNGFYPSLFTKRERLLLYTVILLSLFLTKSRNAIISVVIFYLFRFFYRLSPFIGFLLFLIILFLYQYVAENFPLIVIALGLEEYFRIDTLDTGSGRTIAWNFAWSEIQKNFFLGKGISYTEYLFKKNYTYLSQMGHQGNAHNSYLTIWLDTGLIGLICYLFGLLSLFIKASRYSVIAIPVMYSILFSIFFESWITASLNPFTIILLIIITILASDNIDKNETSQEQAEDNLQS